MFIRKRKEQIVHVLHLKKMEKYEHQYKIIYAMGETMIGIIESKKPLLENLTEEEIKNVSFAPINVNGNDNVNNDTAEGNKNFYIFNQQYKIE